MAVLHGIQDLEKGPLDFGIIADVPTPLGDVGEEITLGTILQDYIGAVWIIHNLEHRDYVRVCGCGVVELDFPGLEFPLPSIQRLSIGIGFAQRFYRIPSAGDVIDRRVHNSIRASTQYPLQLQ